MRSKTRLGVGAGVLLVALGAATPAQEPGERLQAYDGVAALGNLERVTVVYPDAADPTGRRNRDSATIRASYLRERYGVATEVASDKAVTPEQLAGHLLLLGWDNRLLGGERAPSPFRRDATGFDFLGQRGGPADHLLWMHVSPYDPQSYLAFFSRIDSELDRLLTFPFVGSDWVIYRDYFAVAQGMFEDEPAWPPRRNLDAERRVDVVEMPVVKSSAHYRLHSIDPAVTAAADAILEARERALGRAARMLGQPTGADYRVELFVYRDAEQKHERTGVADPLHSLPLRRELHLPLEHARSPHPHEEIHLLAGERFGACYLGLMYEGLAFFVEERERGGSFDPFAALLVERGVEPTLAAFLDDERLRTLVRGGFGFAPAGLFVAWIDSIGGIELVGKAYGLERGTARSELARLVGSAEAEARFASWVAEGARRGKDELAFRNVLARASQRAGVGDLFGRADALREALQLRPEDAEVAYQLGLTLLELGELAEARARFEALAGRPAAGLPPYVPPFTRYQLGRVHEALGERDAALRSYRAVLELPDQRDAHRLAREALARLGEPLPG